MILFCEFFEVSRFLLFEKEIVRIGMLWFLNKNWLCDDVYMFMVLFVDVVVMSLFLGFKYIFLMWVLWIFIGLILILLICV